MAVAMFMNWPGVTKEQYEAVLHELNLDRNPPAGGLFHVSVLLPTGIAGSGSVGVGRIVQQVQRNADRRCREEGGHHDSTNR